VIALSIRTNPDAGTLALGFVQWSTSMSDFRPAFADVRYIFNRHQRRHWETEGASTGQQWPDNWAPEVPWLGSVPYPEWKRRLLGFVETLIVSGRLRSAATGGAGSLQRETATSMEMGVDERAVPYATAHHLGERVMSALFGREVQLKRRAVIRFDGRPLRGKGDAFDDRGATSFGYATRQVIQAHIIRRQREAFGHDTAPADATIARLRSTETR